MYVIYTRTDATDPDTSVTRRVAGGRGTVQDEWRQTIYFERVNGTIAILSAYFRETD